MKSSVRWLVGSLCLVAMGCAQSTNPLSDPVNSAVDKRLIGVWKVVEIGEKPDKKEVDLGVGIIVIGRGAQEEFQKHCEKHGWEQPAYKEFPKGMMAFSGIGLMRDGYLASLFGDNLYFIPSQVGGSSYANLIDVGGDEPDEKGSVGSSKVSIHPNSGNKSPNKLQYDFARYDLQGDRLRVWLKKNSAIEDAIEKKKLAGVIEKGYIFGKSFKVAHLTETTQNLERFIRDGGGIQLFPQDEKPALVCERLKVD